MYSHSHKLGLNENYCSGKPEKTIKNAFAISRNSIKKPPERWETHLGRKLENNSQIHPPIH